MSDTECEKLGDSEEQQPPDHFPARIELLKAKRNTLHHYLLQRDRIWIINVPPAASYGIYEARRNIQRIKVTLQAWGLTVEDLPEDIEEDDSSSPQTKSGSAQHRIEKPSPLRWLYSRSSGASSLYYVYLYSMTCPQGKCLTHRPPCSPAVSASA